MKTLFYTLILLMTPLVFCEVSSTADAEDHFECNPSKKIKDRVNVHCIQASDIAIDNTKPFEIELKKGSRIVGKAFVTSKTNDDGNIRLEISHQCSGKEKSSPTTMIFCGYQKSNLDRTSPGTKEIRQAIADTNKLNEKTNQKEIDNLMAKEINPWLADPRENIQAKDGVLTIKSLQKADGTTCYEAKDLIYKTDCN